jgi:glycosyltransferase involved in cell wall biosynthesis
VPDIIVAHSGWGDGMLLRSVFPDVPQLAYMEYWFRPSGGDLGFMPGSQPAPEVLSQRTIDNSVNATNFFNADWCITPTWWQKSLHPAEMHSRMSVLHEGIDTGLVAPREGLTYELPDGRVLDPRRDEIVTHVERHFDRYRGFPTFLESIDLIQRRRPNAHVVVVGKEGNSYTGASAGTYDEMIRNAALRPRAHAFRRPPWPMKNTCGCCRCRPCTCT